MDASKSLFASRKGVWYEFKDKNHPKVDNWAWSKCALVRARVTPGPCRGIIWAALPLRKDGGNLSTENRDEKFWPAQFCLCQFDCSHLSRSGLISHLACSETICHNTLSTSTSTQVHQKCEHSSLKLCTKAFSWSHKCIMARRPLLLQAYLR